MVRGGRLGEIRFVRRFIPDQIIDEWALDDPTQAWKREPHGCGALQDCGPHMFDLLIWYFGEVETLQAAVQGWVPEVDLDNHAVVAGRMVDGPMFSVEFSSVTEYPRGERVEIYGTEGTLVIDQTLDPPVVFYAGDQDTEGTPVSQCLTTSEVGRRSRSAPRPPISSTPCATAVTRGDRCRGKVRREPRGAGLPVRG